SEVNAELVLTGGHAALLVGGPAVGLVAASDDAVVTGNVVFLGVLRNDRKPVDLALVGHVGSPLRVRWTDGRRAAHRRPRRRCRPCRRHAARTAEGFAWPCPTPAGRRLR